MEFTLIGRVVAAAAAVDGNVVMVLLPFSSPSITLLHALSAAILSSKLIKSFAGINCYIK